MALENIALFTNTKLAKVPTSFADLERQALKAKKKTKAQVGLAVQQGATGDAYHMYPFFSGLGGYIFGTNRAGNLDPSDIGVANAKFLKNAALIDRWNKEGLVRSQVSGDIARDLFTKGKVAYYVTGPWFLGDVQKSGVKYAISAFPAIVPGLKATPFLGVQGFMVTKFSSVHGVESLAKDLVANYMMRPASQLTLAAANQRFPANLVAGTQVKDKDLRAVRQGVGRWRPDAEHPADGKRLAGPRRCVGPVDEGLRRGPRAALLPRRLEKHRAEDRLS